jgi:O-antigen/teichoic acid export membrane protein
MNMPKTNYDFFQVPLYKNSLFIMLTSVSSACFGSIFWILAAKLSPTEDVGIAAALISSMGLIVMLSRLGMDFSLVRFFPQSDKGRIFGTSAIITTAIAVLLGALFIAGVNIFSPELQLLRRPPYALLYIMFVAANSLTAISCTSFVAVRKAGFKFLLSLVVGSRILFLILLMALGALGIFGAVGLSLILALVIAIYLLAQIGIRPQLVIDRGFLNDAFHFSVGNYIAGLFIATPTMILPIMVLNILEAEQAAYYFIAYAIAALLFMIPNAVGMSMFVEGSHGEILRKIVSRSLLAVFFLLVPAAVLLYVLGGWLMGLMGPDYAAGGVGVLRVMIAASFFVALNFMFFSIKRVQQDVGSLVIVSGLIFTLLVGSAYVFMHMFGVVGVGYAWMLSHGIGCVVVGVLLLKER